MAKKLQKGQRFDFNDFLNQLEQMKKMGGMQSMLNKLPMIGQIPAKAASLMDEKVLVKMEAIIHSMTEKERLFPALLNNASRKQRISRGSGTSPQDIAKLLKQFTQMEKMLKKLKGDKMMKRLNQMQDQLPPIGKGNFKGILLYPRQFSRQYIKDLPAVSAAESWFSMSLPSSAWA